MLAIEDSGRLFFALTFAAFSLAAIGGALVFWPAHALAAIKVQWYKDEADRSEDNRSFAGMRLVGVGLLMCAGMCFVRIVDIIFNVKNVPW